MTTDDYVATMARLIEQERYREIVELSRVPEEEIDGRFSLSQLSVVSDWVTMSINMVRLDEIEAGQAAEAKAPRWAAG